MTFDEWGERIAQMAQSEGQSDFEAIKRSVAQAIEIGLVPPNKDGVRTALKILTAPWEEAKKLIMTEAQKSVAAPEDNGKRN